MKTTPLVTEFNELESFTMEITEVRVKLIDYPDDRLQAFCSVTFDNCFVIRDLKIIEGSNGPFVAMPSRKLTSHCGRCRCKNHLRASYCNQCGIKLKLSKMQQDNNGRVKLYADIAHPINSECREQIQAKVIKEYRAELQRSSQTGYESRYDEEYSESAPYVAHQVRIGESVVAGPHKKNGASRQSEIHAEAVERGHDEFGAGIF